ncbi:MAG TPA: ComEC/Rec2 family competence protein [Sunxiuqinia sp.]|nr:ComEC/Rec2 family competence protein [Sunxiuqinia sp.]
MDFFTNNPFTKILSFWLIGLLAGFIMPVLFWVFLLGCFIFGGLAIAQLKRKRYPFDLYLSLFLAFSFMLTAFYSVQKKEPSTNAQQHRFLATVTHCPVEKPNSYQTQLTINQCANSKINGQTIIAYLAKSASADRLNAGDQLVIKSKLQRIKNLGGPYTFNYQKFMANRGIYFSCYLPEESYHTIYNSHSNSIIIEARKVRSALIEQLKKYIHDDQILQVVSALTLGYRQELSPETKHYFVSTGAMHVLAVSGLHVGMIYFFLAYLLAFLKRNRVGRVSYFIIIISLLWSYALLTGFSPSVQRATVMFCFILFGESIRRSSSIYNSIAASALLLLVFNPNLIHEVGFQLSYAAVTSIVFLYPKLVQWWRPKYWLLSKMWQLFCVSLAAQIGTLPFSLFYFHQFPVYFWLSNFIVIPAAYLILGLTFLFFITSPFKLVALFTAKSLTIVTGTTIQVLKHIDHLPYSLIENISISLPQVVLLLFISISAAFFINQKRTTFLFASLVFLSLFLVAGFVEKAHYFNQQKMIIYNREEKILLIDGRTNYLLFHTKIPGQPSPEIAVIRQLQLNNPVEICLDSCTHFESEDFILNDQTFQFLNQTFQLNERKENQQTQRRKGRRSNFFQLKNLSQTKNESIDSTLNSGSILNLCDLAKSGFETTDMQIDRK